MRVRAWAISFDELVWNVCWMAPCRRVDLSKARSCLHGGGAVVGLQSQTLKIGCD